MKFTAELIEKVKNAKSMDELIALTKENGVEITAEEAERYFARLNPKEGELADDELDNVSGGGCERKIDGGTYTVVSCGVNCFIDGGAGFQPNTRGFGDFGSNLFVVDDNIKLRNMWYQTQYSAGNCGQCTNLKFDGCIGYCGLSNK